MNPQPSYLKWYVVIATIFLVAISFNFIKPFGFFRESNPALVAINATYWENNPDIRKQHIPVSSYAFNKTADPKTQFDNTITTFGFAWFAAPFYFLHFTKIPIGPVGLRIFSLLWLLLTVFSIYTLARQLSQQYNNNRFLIFLSVALYVVSPVVMWYQVNGYVHETAVLPFYYLGWYFFIRFTQQKNLKWLWCTALILFIGIQFDWLPFFQGIVMSAYLLFSKKEKLSRRLFFIPGIAILLGILFIIYNYASWSSVKDYFHFMRWKFGTRTVGEEGPRYISVLPPNLNIFLFYIISYGVLLGWCIVGLLKKKLHPFLLLMVITAVLHHIVFWGFSSEHDYAALKMAFPICFVAAVFISQMKRLHAMVSFFIIIIFAVVQYFLLHNYTSRKGIYEDDAFFFKAGYILKKYPVDTIVFVNTDGKYFPQIEYYAGRPYLSTSSIQDAKQQLIKLKKTEARFINIPPVRTEEFSQRYVLKVQVSDTTKAK